MIFINECRRIVRPGMLVFLFVFSLLWYLAFMENCNAYLGDNMGMPYAIAMDYVHRFGTTIDAYEIEEVRKDYETAEAGLNALIRQYMGEYGIRTKEEFDQYTEEYPDTETCDKLESIYWDDSLHVISASFKAQSIGSYVDEWERMLEAEKAYENADDDWFFWDATDEEKQVLDNRFKKKEISVAAGFFGMLEENFKSFSGSWSLLIFICCAIVMIPVLVKNRIQCVTPLQYTTKQGKRILSKQLAAALCTGLVLCAVLVAVFQLFYFHDGAGDFIHCPINLIVSDGLFWFDFTLLEYMVCLWAKTVLLVICEILVLFWVSCHANNYVTASAVCVPVIIAVHLLCDKANHFLQAFHGYAPFCYPLVLGAVVCAAIVVSAVFMCRAKKADYPD